MIRAVFFDAVGTLIDPRPSSIDVYHDVGHRFGSRLGRDDVRERFHRAFLVEEELDRARGQTTDDDRELERWRRIVAAVLDDVDDAEACFQTLWQHFADPHSWRCADAAEVVLRELTQRGRIVGMASNFDRRLRSVIAGLPELRFVSHIVVSSEIGVRKPSSAFFDRVIASAGVKAEEILFVGDDPVNDRDAPQASGMHARLLGPQGSPTDLGCLLHDPILQ